MCRWLNLNTYSTLRHIKFTAYTSFLDHFEALARLIELSRRSGQLMNSTSYLEDATKACARSAYEPGLNYCKGLMKRWHLYYVHIPKSV